ncbi:MAG: hypothetical protein ACXABY_03810 [Candidatus Thorarchaeota archaeon]|jgi:hypothetical protein
MEVSVVPPEEVWRVWPKVFHFIKKSVDASGNRDSVDNALNDLMECKAVLWIVFDDDLVIHAGAILKKMTYPDNTTVMRVCHIGGSSGNKWFNKLYKTLNKFADDNQCDCLEGECIPKWEPLMKRMKAVEISRVYRMPVRTG